MEPLQVTIYNEFVHEQKNGLVKKIYPKGIHGAIAEYMRKEHRFQPPRSPRTHPNSL